MAYLTYDEYAAYNTGVTLSAEDFAVQYFYAETAIDSYIGRHINTPSEKLKKAVAMQIALSSKSGGVEYYVSSASTTELASESVPNYSYSMSAKTKTQYTAAKDAYGLFPAVASLLTEYYVQGIDVIL
jgi:hypothetical protein